MDHETWGKSREKLKTLLLEECVSGGEDSFDSFLPRGKAREVFLSHKTVLKDLHDAVNTPRKQDDNQFASFFAAVIGESDDRSLSKILATLLYGPTGPNSASWRSFEDLCKQSVGDRKFFDKDLPLSKQDVAEFLGAKNVDRDNFSKDQYMFSPLVLSKRDMIDTRQGRKLCLVPYVNEEFIKGGSHGKVYRVTLAGDHFGLGSNGRTICARKDYDITKSHTFEAERKYALVLAENERCNENILEIFAGLRTPTSLTLFCELADSDLGDFMENAEKPSDLADINRRLVQFNGIVRAVEFLHTEVIDKNGTRECCFHLDLKPKNILVFNKGKQDEIFKISDFSISRSKNKAEYYKRLLELQESIRDMSTAATLGDANTCLAPEAFGEGRVNASNDIWHLGCVLCMFIAWLYNGPEGLRAFNNDRYSEQQGADWFFSSLEQDERPADDETEYWRESPKGDKFFFFRLSIEVDQWLDQLLEHTKGRPEAATYSILTKFLKEDLLVANPKERKKIEPIRQRLDSIIGEYTSSRNRTDSLLKAPSPGRPSSSARPVRKKRNIGKGKSHKHGDKTTLESSEK